MRLKDTSIAAVVVLAALLSPGGGLAPVAAQSLADVARKEQERRKAIKETVQGPHEQGSRGRSGGHAARGDPGAADGATPAEPGKDATKAEPATTDAAKTEPAKDQAYWSGRAKDLQTQLSRNETFAVALQSRINALSNEYTNQGDGVRQQAIAAEQAEGDRRAEPAQRRKSKTTRRPSPIFRKKRAAAGVPPGWLR